MSTTTSDATEALLDEIAAAGAAAPGLRPLETANVLLHAEKARRITQDERRRSLTTLAALPIHIDPDTAAQAFGRTPRCANAAWRGAMRPWQIRRVLEQAAGEIEVTGKSGHGGHTRPTRQEQNDEGSAACEAVGTGR